MHNILMESYSIYIDHQKRLNPAMNKEVKADVLKLLNECVIYVIFDSSWVLPVQLISNKGGMIVVKNQKNKLISSHTVTGWRV